MRNLKSSNDTDCLKNLCKQFEYDMVVDRCVNLKRLHKAHQIRIKSKEQVYIVIASICDAEGIQVPKVKFTKRTRSSYFPSSHKIKFRVYGLTIHTVIHELAHAIHCQLIKEGMVPDDKRHHGWMFCVLQDWLLYKYEDIWGI